MIKKAVIPIAGYGTRMLPATKVLPKAMLNIVNKPIIEYLIDEIIEAGITEILLITNSYSTIIQGQFSRNYELEYFLEKNNDIQILNEIRNKYNNVQLYIKRASTNESLAESVYDAKEFVQDEPFLLILGDEILEKGTFCSKVLVENFNKIKVPIIAVKKVLNSERPKYGIVEGKKYKDDLIIIENMLEKPKIDQTNSNLAIIGRYILNNSIFDKIGEQIKKEEKDFTKAILNMEELKIAMEISGERFDCGSKSGLVKANIKFALEDDEIREEILEYIKRIKEI